MNFKKLLSLLVATTMICSTSAFAIASRTDYRKEVVVESKAQANDLYFEDFTSVKPGEIPTSVVATPKTDLGYVTTAKTDVGNGKEKNCLMLVDTNGAKDVYTGAIAQIKPGGKYTGLIGIEYRYKFMKKDGGNNWMSFMQSAYGSNGAQASYTYILSNNGQLQTYDSATNVSLMSEVATDEAWFTIKMVINTEKQVFDISALSEKSGKYNVKAGLKYYTDKPEDIASLYFRTSAWDGTYAIDYIRFTQESEMMVTGEDGASKVYEIIPGPKHNELVGRTNIKVDDKIKYTTKAPKVVDGNVLVTAKNLASFLDMNYFKNSEGYILQKDKLRYVINEDGSEISRGGMPIELSELCTKEDRQVFVPIETIVKALGYKYQFDTETNTVNISTGLVTEEKEDK